MVKIAEIGNVSVRRVTEFTPWFDVYIGEKHNKGFAEIGDAFNHMMHLLQDDQ
jgi:hypothetical protein